MRAAYICITVLLLYALHLTVPHSVKVMYPVPFLPQGDCLQPSRFAWHYTVLLLEAEERKSAFGSHEAVRSSELPEADTCMTWTAPTDGQTASFTLTGSTRWSVPGQPVPQIF